MYPLHRLRRTKIIATLGPATDKANVLQHIVSEGVDVVRLNFSHGTWEEHAKRVLQVKKIAKKLKKVIGILVDLQGPKIRVASFKNKRIHLKPGQKFTLDAALETDMGDENQVGIDYKNLPRDVLVNDILLLDDGRIKLRVLNITEQAIDCEVEVGGVLSNHKGINRLGGGLSAPALTKKDVQDLEFALTLGIDYVAISFPRNSEDILQAKQFIKKHNANAGVIAKIERIEAVQNIEEIIRASDGVMVARGDLAVEIGDAEVPLVQKDIIHRARDLNKPVIIATQMMESMILSSVPTRAEVSDVANAVLDNADAVMLSAETATGAYPVQTVAAMSRTCRVAESLPSAHYSTHRHNTHFERIDEAIAMATMYTANHLDIRCILTLTESGATPLWMSRIRTAIPIYGLSRYERSLGRMTLYRGVYPIEFDPTRCKRADVNKAAVKILQDLDYAKEGDMVILTKGEHMGIGGGSNALKILKVGQVE